MIVIGGIVWGMMIGLMLWFWFNEYVDWWERKHQKCWVHRTDHRQQRVL